MKKLILLLPLLYGCSSTRNCATCSTIIAFPPMCIQTWDGNNWKYINFPADTLEIDKNVCILK